MSILKRRLIHLWRHQSTLPNPPHPWPAVYPDSIFVTLAEPMKISGTMLSPGRYEFRPLDPGAEHPLLQVFSEDHTTLVATLTPRPHN
jgi:hypothetical protein